MAEFDHGVKLITDTTARELARVAGLECRRRVPRLMALYTLCRHGRTPPKAVRQPAEAIERGDGS
jgi:hypothetical protein